MSSFPSVDWFDDVRRVFNADDRYRGAGGGHCNCLAGFKIGERVFVATFEGVECSGAVEGDESALDDVDFYLDMPADEWREMVANIAANGSRRSPPHPEHPRPGQGRWTRAVAPRRPGAGGSVLPLQPDTAVLLRRLGTGRYGIRT